MVINILKDGRVVEDLSTIEVPVTEDTMRAYELIANS